MAQDLEALKGMLEGIIENSSCAVIILPMDQYEEKPEEEAKEDQPKGEDLYQEFRQTEQLHVAGGGESEAILAENPNQ